MATSTDDHPPTLGERYRSSINTSNLGSDPRTFRSPSDVVGAYGLAARNLTDGFVRTGPNPEDGYDIRPAPLAVPLERLLAGDSKAVHGIVQQLAEMAFGHSKHLRLKIGRAVAHDLACCSLAWFRNGTCRACGGHGYDLVRGAPTLSERECTACRGTGKILLEESVDPDHKNPGYREIVAWLVVEITREAGRASSAAMAKISQRMEL
jgi:hypothetical protein